MIDEEYKKEKEVMSGKALLQLRNTTGTNQLHIQGWDTEGNRTYGYANKFTVPSEVTDSLEKYEADKFQSLASDQEIYYRDVLTVVEYDDGFQIHISIDDNEANNDTVWTLDINLPQCESFIKWCLENGLVTPVSCSKFKGGKQ